MICFPYFFSSFSPELGPCWADLDRISLTSTGDVQFSIWVSFFEIYNELIYDLLEPVVPGQNRKRQTLRLCEDQTGSPYVKGRDTCKRAESSSGLLEGFRVEWVGGLAVMCWGALQRNLMPGFTGSLNLLMSRMCTGEVGAEISFLPVSQLLCPMYACFPDLNWINVRDADEAWKLLKLGRKNQSFASTHMNQNSSRRSEGGGIV